MQTSAPTTGALLRTLAADAPPSLAQRARKIARDLDRSPSRRLENAAADLMALLCALDSEPAELDDPELLDPGFDG